MITHEEYTRQDWEKSRDEIRTLIPTVGSLCNSNWRPERRGGPKEGVHAWQRLTALLTTRLRYLSWLLGLAYWQENYTYVTYIIPPLGEKATLLEAPPLLYIICPLFPQQRKRLYMGRACQRRH